MPAFFKTVRLWLVRRFPEFRDLERRVATDSLTHLLTRSGADMKLEGLLAELKRQGYHRQERPHAMSALFMDLDHFKEVNDRYGHAAGDEVLTVIAEHLRQAFRSSDVLCRPGGDEFFAIMINAGLDEAHRRARQLQRSIGGDSRLTLGDTRRVTISIGIAHGYFGSRSGGFEVLNRLKTTADAAMYEAKEQRQRDGQIVVAPVIEYSDTQRGNL